MDGGALSSSGKMRIFIFENVVIPILFNIRVCKISTALFVAAGLEMLKQSPHDTLFDPVLSKNSQCLISTHFSTIIRKNAAREVFRSLRIHRWTFRLALEQVPTATVLLSEKEKEKLMLRDARPLDVNSG